MGYLNSRGSAIKSLVDGASKYLSLVEILVPKHKHPFFTVAVFGKSSRHLTSREDDDDI